MIQILKDKQWVDFGQEQLPYTISIVKDETLDSCKIVCNNFDINPLLPTTTLKVGGEYWYVEGDKTTRRGNKQTTHEIELSELTQLLNDRFVEDCKFAQDTYTLEKAMTRLLKLSNSEDLSVAIPYYIKDKKVNQFEFKDANLFNALVELFRSLGFYPRVIYNEIYEKPFVITFDTLDAQKDIIHNFSEIKDIEVVRELSRNNNASQVVSNIYNATPNEWSFFPNQYNGKLLYPVDYGTTLEQEDIGILKLPSKIKDINEIYIYPKFEITLTTKNYKGIGGATRTFKLYGNRNTFINDILETFKDYANDTSFVSSTDKQAYLENVNTIYNMLNNEFNFSPYLSLQEGKFKQFSGYDEQQGAILWGGAIKNEKEIGLSFLEKKKYDLLSEQYVFDEYRIIEKEAIIYWEQGGDYVRGFDQETYKSYAGIFEYNILGTGNLDNVYNGLSININADLSKDDVRVGISYLPMDDLKVSIKNGVKDYSIIKQYNQTSNMVDFGRATNDLQNYIDEMQSKDIIVRGIYTNKSKIFKVGTILRDDETNIDYVITKESIEVNGNNNYEVIYQLNEEYIRRSEFVTADSDIRDYEIPITNIVTRKKQFSMQIEFSYEDKDENRASGSLFNNLFSKTLFKDYTYTTALLKCVYKDGKVNYFTTPITPYISLNSSSAYLNVKIDDNYIIGQTRKSKYTGKDILETYRSIDLRVWLDKSYEYYTPIRYTDLDGEIQDLEVILFKGDELGLNSFGIVNEAMPNGNIEVQDYRGQPQSLYDAVALSNGAIRLNITDFMKDRYEKIQIGYGVYYRGDNDIELDESVVSAISNAALGRVQEDCYVKLYNKNNYPYINKKTYRTIRDSYDLKPNITRVSLGNGCLIELEEEIDLSQYNIVICAGGTNEMLLALNNNKYGLTNKIQIYTYNYKY